MGNGNYEKDIRDFLGAWSDYLQRRGINDGQGYWTQLMREVSIIFQEVTSTITQRSGENASICGSIYTGAQPNMSTCKSRCHEIANLMLYIKGYSYSKGTWTTRRADHTRRAPFTEYLRCTLGTEVLLQLYGQTSDHREIIEKVEQHMRNTDAPGHTHYAPGVCEGRDYGEVIFGVGGIGPGLQQRINEWQQGLPGGKTRSTHGTGQQCAWAHREREDSEQKCNEQSVQTPQDSELMRSIKYWAHTTMFRRVTPVLDDMQKEEASKKKCELEKKIKEGVQKVKEKVNPKRVKPAPAKPAPPPVDGGKKPVKPVAPQPASTAVATTDGKPTTTGPGATTTTSVGGGGKTGKAGGATPGGGKEKAPKATTATEDNCAWRSVMDTGHSGLHVKGIYSSEQLQALKTVLQEFSDYMDKNKEHMDTWGTNCENYGWDDFPQQHGHTIGQRVADVVRCRLMTLALFFANQHGHDGNSGKAQNTDDDKLYERFRCELANVFGYMLKTMYCKKQGTWKRGVEYAWKTVQQMGKDEKTGAVTISGPVMEGRCTECGYDIEKRGVRVVDGAMVNLLIHEGNLMGRIGQLENSTDCSEKWEEYKSGPGRTDGDGNVDWQKIPEVTTTETEIIEKTKEAVTQIATEIDTEIAKNKALITTDAVAVAAATSVDYGSNNSIGSGSGSGDDECGP
ncbi:hypothetical protein AK88_05406 [Plasmodium fragile]|uniref:Schizont-infected cell agglutination extracellular alpha domain-containing protein n=1 Tax=Plasmodium fragile TaxID=5857 RepID=A0A0D9QDP9_PLAFR|nr:uncharacterized protein AK88_05406 [Plasmodium fragile]KJP84967.1 hypothetical protein AK88_05406 [Plasmodium fragile]